MRRSALSQGRVGPNSNTPFRGLLFDRLSSRLPEESTRVPHDVAFLRNSLRAEIHRLLNSRRIATGLLDARVATTLDYGIPDFTFRSLGAPDQLAELAAIVTNAIQIFEPRLRNPQVRIEPDPHRANHALVQLEGSVLNGVAWEQFRFTLQMDEQSMVQTAEQDS